MIREGEPIYLIIDPAKVDEAVRDLIHVGLDNIAGWFNAANLPEYQRAAGTLESTTEIHAADARAWVARGEPFVLDVRRAAEHAEGHIEGALNIAHTRLLSRLDEIPRERPILVHCRSGVRSARASALLQRHGFSVTNLAGGFLAWEELPRPRP
jgi:hydroxyacylglutathione hydrolase